MVRTSTTFNLLNHKNNVLGMYQQVGDLFTTGTLFVQWRCLLNWFWTTPRQITNWVQIIALTSKGWKVRVDCTTDHAPPSWWAWSRCGVLCTCEHNQLWCGVVTSGTTRVVWPEHAATARRQQDVARVYCYCHWTCMCVCVWLCFQST